MHAARLCYGVLLKLTTRLAVLVLISANRVVLEVQLSSSLLKLPPEGFDGVDGSDVITLGRGDSGDVTIAA